MKLNYKNLGAFILLILFKCTVYAQCASTITIGSSSNLFTLIRNSTNPIAADKNLNTIVYAHRNNATGFGGNSGQLRYDVSTNAGTTWTTNLGVLNPIGTSPARYPNAAIFNPSLNVNPSNAYIAYMAATINSTSSAWNGQVTGVRQLNGTGNTENYNQTGNPTPLITHAMVKGAPGVFWSVDAIYNGTNVTGFSIYKGTWNGTTDVNWVTNFSVTPSFNTSFSSVPQTGDYNIAFDPTGTIGYMSFLSHLNGGPTNYAYYPVFYKTTDGGNSWTGPIQVDLNQFSCATAILTGTNVITTSFEHDLAVDVNGNPHLFTTLCNGNNGYSVFYGSTHRMFDITQLNGVWNAYDIANVNAGRGIYGTSTNTVSMDMEPQISRTADGTRLFFSWTDNSTYILGAANQTPNLFARGFNVTTNQFTPIKDFTSCNSGLNGQILFPHLASEVLEPLANTFQLASVYGELTVANDLLQISNFKFLNNTTFISSDFSINQPTVAVSIVQGTNYLLCPSATASLNIIGAYNQVLWSNGTITNSTTASTAGIYTVTVRNGCTTGASTIAVTNLTANLTPTASSICNGSSSTLSVTSNAISYTWSPVSSSSASILVTPSVTTVYTLTATGNNCTYPQTLSVIVNALPTVSATSGAICSGSSFTLVASGANTYTYSSGSAVVSPTTNSTYSVVGTSTAGCVSSNTAVSSVTVNALPSVSLNVSQGTVCVNSATVALTGSPSGGIYSGSNVVGSVFTPSSVAGTYTQSYAYTNTVTGCAKTATSSVVVSLCTGIQSFANNQNISVYPNPSKEIINVDIEMINTPTKITVLNTLGQVLFIENITILHASFNISHFPVGLYILKAETNGEVKTLRLIKE